MDEGVKSDRLVLRLQQVYKERVVVLVVSPDAKKLERGLRADAESL